MESVAKRFTNVIGKAVFCLFLMFATVTHALAEPGVFGEAHAHAIDTMSLESMAVPSNGDENSRNDGSAKDSSFNHAAHDAAAPPRAPDMTDLRLPERPFASLVAQRLPASPMDGPERPPRA